MGCRRPTGGVFSYVSSDRVTLRAFPVATPRGRSVSFPTRGTMVTYVTWDVLGTVWHINKHWKITPKCDFSTGRSKNGKFVGSIFRKHSSDTLHYNTVNVTEAKLKILHVWIIISFFFSFFFKATEMFWHYLFFTWYIQTFEFKYCTLIYTIVNSVYNGKHYTLVWKEKNPCNQQIYCCIRLTPQYNLLLHFYIEWGQINKIKQILSIHHKNLEAHVIDDHIWTSKCDASAQPSCHWL